jgi:hypothetical protein
MVAPTVSALAECPWWVVVLILFVAQGSHWVEGWFDVWERRVTSRRAAVTAATRWPEEENRWMVRDTRPSARRCPSGGLAGARLTEGGEGTCDVLDPPLEPKAVGRSRRVTSR